MTSSKANPVLTDVYTALELAAKKGCPADFDGEKSVELINSAERALSIRFPPTYKAFLQELGSGDVAGCEFYGLVSYDFENSGVPDAIWLTLRERKESALSEKLVIVGSAGDGSYYALDCKQPSANGECPIIRLELGAAGLSLGAEIAPNFGSFFLDQVQSVLE